VAVLGPVVHQQQHARRRQAVDERVEKRLGLGVDPVQVLEHDDERLHRALAQEEPLDPVERALAPPRGLERLPLGIVHGHVEEPEERRQGRLERAVERQQLARHLLVSTGSSIPLTGRRPSGTTT